MNSEIQLLIEESEYDHTEFAVLLSHLEGKYVDVYADQHPDTRHAVTMDMSPVEMKVTRWQIDGGGEWIMIGRFIHTSTGDPIGDDHEIRLSDIEKLVIL